MSFTVFYCSHVQSCVYHEPLFLIAGHNACVNSVHWSHDNQWVITCSDDKAAKIWNKAGTDPIMTFSSIKDNFDVDKEGPKPTANKVCHILRPVDGAALTNGPLFATKWIKTGRFFFFFFIYANWVQNVPLWVHKVPQKILAMDMCLLIGFYMQVELCRWIHRNSK